MIVQGLGATIMATDYYSLAIVEDATLASASCRNRRAPSHLHRPPRVYQNTDFSQATDPC